MEFAIGKDENGNFIKMEYQPEPSSAIDNKTNYPMTNYEKIKNYSVDEMASLITEDVCKLCPYDGMICEFELDHNDANHCYKGIIEWLLGVMEKDYESEEEVI